MTRVTWFDYERQVVKDDITVGTQLYVKGLSASFRDQQKVYLVAKHGVVENLYIYSDSQDSGELFYGWKSDFRPLDYDNKLNECTFTPVDGCTDTYDTKCGHQFYDASETGNPVTDWATYCPYCGGKIKL